VPGERGTSRATTRFVLRAVRTHRGIICRLSFPCDDSVFDVNIPGTRSRAIDTVCGTDDLVVAPTVPVEDVPLPTTGSHLGTSPVQRFRTGQMVTDTQERLRGSAFTLFRHKKYSPFTEAPVILEGRKLAGQHISPTNMPAPARLSHVPHRCEGQSSEVNGGGKFRMRTGNGERTNRRSGTASRNLTLATAAFALTFWVWNLIGPLSHTYSEHLRLSPTQTSILVAVPVLVGSLGRVPVGTLTDRYGGRSMFTVICFVSIVPTFLVGVSAASYGLLLLWGFFLGLAGTSFAVGILFVSSWYEVGRRGFATGV